MTRLMTMYTGPDFTRTNTIIELSRLRPALSSDGARQTPLLVVRRVIKYPKPHTSQMTKFQTKQADSRQTASISLNTMPGKSMLDRKVEETRLRHQKTKSKIAEQYLQLHVTG